MYYVYAISSQTRKYIYVGLTNDPIRRLLEHNNGKEKTTKPYVPFKKILLEKYQTRRGARTREKYLKSGIGKELLKRIS